MTREIDARVAREVMGFETREAYDSVYIFMGPGKLADPRSGANTLSPAMGFEDGYLFSIPLYTTDLNAAIDVVEKMRRLGWWMTFCNESSGYSCKMWKDDVSPMVERSPIYANTPAVAICLAALEAVKSDR